jgi:hypothetical protein
LHRWLPLALLSAPGIPLLGKGRVTQKKSNPRLINRGFFPRFCVFSGSRTKTENLPKFPAAFVSEEADFKKSASSQKKRKKQLEIFAGFLFYSVSRKKC